MRGRLLIVSASLLAAALLSLPAPALGDFELLPGSGGFDAAVTAEGGGLAKEAGSHPLALTMSVGLNQVGQFTKGDLRDLSFELPPGLIENPTVLPTCDQSAFHTQRSSPFETSLSGESCPDRTQVGTIEITSSHGGGETRTFGLFNVTPVPGVPSELAANPYGGPIVFIPSIRQAEGEYGLTLHTQNLSQLTDISSLSLTLWGTPWSVLHNEQRGNCLNELEPTFGWAKCSVGRPNAFGSTPRAYLTLPTSCEEPLSFTAVADSWQEPGIVIRQAQQPALESCNSLEFEPRAQAFLTDPRASSPSGYQFDIDVDTEGVTNPRRRTSSPVRKAVIALPEGVTINPSVGAGLGVCTPAQFAAETPSSLPGAGCPNPSKIGDFTVHTPLTPGTVEGAIFIAEPYRNPFGSLIAIYLVAKSISRGIMVKVAGELHADPSTGRLTATFDKLPQLPYSDLSIHFREGQRSPLATPPACGARSTEADLTAWRNTALVRHASLPTSITAGYGGGACPSGIPPFTPQAQAGSLNSNAGSYTPFYLHLTRTVTEQEITSYSAKFPPGLLGKIAGIPYCSDAAIAAAKLRTGVEERDNPSCPAASLIGHTYSGYGVGSALSYAPGGLYLAGPYHGSSFSVVAIDSALVGPFDLGVVIVRSAIKVDPLTTQVSIDSTGSDPIPHIIKGIPIHLRDVRVYVDRHEFAVNPTSCEPFSVAATLKGSGARFDDPSDDSIASPVYRYQAFNCSALNFKPKTSLKLNGGTTRGRHPSLRVVVKPRRGNANIAAASVTLPHSLFLEQNHINTVCSKVLFAAKSCPPGSVYGHVRVFTPLLADPMEGPVYLRSSESTLPDLVFALHGQGIEVDLAGQIDSPHGGIRGTFQGLPDAPVSKFVLRMFGGKRGVLVNAANTCAKPQFANARFLGQANRGWISHPEVKADCKTHKKRHPKRGKGRTGQ